jgi:hypothetical protein
MCTVSIARTIKTEFDVIEERSACRSFFVTEKQELNWIETEKGVLS